MSGMSMCGSGSGLGGGGGGYQPGICMPLIDS